MRAARRARTASPPPCAARSDTNGDGKVTLEEYLADRERIASVKDVYEARTIKLVTFLMSFLDLDGDSKFNYDDVTRFAKAYGFFQEDGEKYFKNMDSDRDGYITTDQLYKIVDQYFHSNDPEAPGNWLFGSF
jgi:hypothetical protein